MKKKWIVKLIIINTLEPLTKFVTFIGKKQKKNEKWKWEKRYGIKEKKTLEKFNKKQQQQQHTGQEEVTDWVKVSEITFHYRLSIITLLLLLLLVVIIRPHYIDTSLAIFNFLICPQLAGCCFFFNFWFEFQLYIYIWWRDKTGKIIRYMFCYRIFFFVCLC